MTTETAPKRYLLWGILGLLVLFLGLCTLFVLVVTIGEAWQEHTEDQWPAATARIQECDFDRYTVKPGSYWILCRISYLLGDEEITTTIHSSSTPAPRRVLGAHPAAQAELMEDWAAAHPQGTPIVIHYDPANHKKAVALTTDMPLGGRRTPTNLKLLEAFAGAFAVLLLLSRLTRPPKSGWPVRTSSIPQNF